MAMFSQAYNSCLSYFTKDRTQLDMTQLDRTQLISSFWENVSDLSNRSLCLNVAFLLWPFSPLEQVDLKRGQK